MDILTKVLSPLLTPIPEGSARADLGDGNADLHVRNICSVFDFFTVENSLTPTRPLETL
jgi:hypothetical protein